MFARMGRRNGRTSRVPKPTGASQIGEHGDGESRKLAPVTSPRATESTCPSACEFRQRLGQLEICAACGLGRTLSRVASRDAQDYSRAEPSRATYFEGICSTLLTNVARGRALDVGCGSGGLVDALERHGWAAQGIDSYAGSADDPRLIRSSIEDYAGAPGFALITMVHSLEHFDLPHEALRRAHELLAPEGCLLVVVPNFGGAWSRLAGEDWSMLNTAEHRYHFTHVALVQMLMQSGLQIERLETHSDYAPSLVQVHLMARDFYGHGLGRHLPLRPLAFRAATTDRVRTWLNALADRFLVGAELRALARRPHG